MLKYVVAVALTLSFLLPPQVAMNVALAASNQNQNQWLNQVIADKVQVSIDSSGLSEMFKAEAGTRPGEIKLTIQPLQQSAKPVALFLTINNGSVTQIRTVKNKGAKLDAETASLTAKLKDNSGLLNELINTPTENTYSKFESLLGGEEESIVTKISEGAGDELQALDNGSVPKAKTAITEKAVSVAKSAAGFSLQKANLTARAAYWAVVYGGLAYIVANMTIAPLIVAKVAGLSFTEVLPMYQAAFTTHLLFMIPFKKALSSIIKYGFVRPSFWLLNATRDESAPAYPEKWEQRLNVRVPGKIKTALRLGDRCDVILSDVLSFIVY